jgi:hypothetical protein
MNMRNSLILIIYDRVRYLDTGPKLDTEAEGRDGIELVFFFLQNFTRWSVNKMKLI